MESHLIEIIYLMIRVFKGSVTKDIITKYIITKDLSYKRYKLQMI